MKIKKGKKKEKEQRKDKKMEKGNRRLLKKVRYILNNCSNSEKTINMLFSSLI